MALTRIPSNLFADVVNRKFETLAAVAGFSPSAAPLFIETAGYASAGDGGAALYRLVASEPSHSAKFSLTTVDGSLRWYELAEQSTNTRMFGGNIPAACLFQRTKGGRVRIPHGQHPVVAQILLDYTSQTGDVNTDPRGVYLAGEGLHNTLLVNQTAGPAIQIIGEDQVNSGFSVLTYAGVEDLSIIGSGRGIRMLEAAFCSLSNIMMRDFAVAMDLVSVLSCSFDRIMITGGIHGVQAYKGSGFSDHNANKWEDAEFRLGTGVAYAGGPISGLWFDNLTVQGWGTHGDLSTGGLDLNFTGNEGGVGLTIDSGYFEFNRGGFDIRLTNNGPEHVTHRISGVNFTRLGSSEFVKNNIVASGGGPQTIVLEGCQFGGRGGYVPDASRTYVSKTPNVSIVCLGCRFDNATEQGDLVNVT